MMPRGSTERLPPNYRLVLDVVRALEPGVHASVADIFLRARVVKPTLGYSTIYRALASLCDLGHVIALHLPGQGAALYEPARSSHVHFVCAGCGRVVDVNCTIPSTEIRGAVSALGGHVDEVVLTATGRCGECLARGLGPSVG